jgi:hypothetical protein
MSTVKNPIQAQIDALQAQQKASDPRSIEQNPLFLLAKGIQPVSQLAAHKKSAKVGNLFFEYVQNANTLKGVVRSGAQVAEYLESLNLITWDRTNDRYMWIGEPMTRSQFLAMFPTSSLRSV